MSHYRILGIDPGTHESAYVVYNATLKHPVDKGKVPNNLLLALIPQLHYTNNLDTMAIELVASYGMAVGQEVFETCIWTGRFIQKWESINPLAGHARVFRKDVKMHLCGNVRAKDSNIRQALIDRYGGQQAAIGRKAHPGPLHGFSKDLWSALAVAITAAER